MIDLSHPIFSGMQVTPGDPAVQVSPALTRDRDGVEVAELTFGSHTGTHVDAPAHLIDGRRTLDAFSLDELVGDALIIDVVDRVREGSLIDAALVELERFDDIPRIVVIATGWDRWFGSENYLRHPRLDPGLVAELLKRGMRVLAVDMPSVDRDEAETADTTGSSDGLPVHRLVLEADGLIVENLRGLDALGGRARIGIFPLPLAGADGAPARVVAW
ncbi:MAG: cyclase family protein [Leucobacter sp.]